MNRYTIIVIFYVIKFPLECPNGSYGYNCEQNCSSHCEVSEICDRMRGECLCQVGWKPNTCESRRHLTAWQCGQMSYINDTCKIKETEQQYLLWFTYVI